MVRQYLDHSEAILSDRRSGYKPNRTGIDSISLFGYQNEYDLSEGFPLLTTKRVPMKAITHELIWFMRGDTNIKYLVDNNVHIWDGNAFQHHVRKQNYKNLEIYSPEWNEMKDKYIEMIGNDEEFAKEHGDLGDVYGAQWRHWTTSNGREIDQFSDVISALKNSPMSRRIIVSAWNPEEIPNMALPPCHCLYHLNVLDGKLDCQLYQRSCDMFLGVPFNIASYAMLTQVLAQQADLELGRFIHTFGDSHFYCGADERGAWYGDNLDELKQEVSVAAYNGRSGFLDIKKWIEGNAPPESEGKEGQDHVTAILEQLSREPRELPKLEISYKNFDELTIDDFELRGYKPAKSIRRAMAV